MMSVEVQTDDNVEIYPVSQRIKSKFTLWVQFISRFNVSRLSTNILNHDTCSVSTDNVEICPVSMSRV